MGSYAASGGYWISAYADRIFAEPTTITGSIGVFGMQFDVQRLADSLGVTFDRVKTGRFADAMTVSLVWRGALEVSRAAARGLPAPQPPRPLVAPGPVPAPAAAPAAPPASEVYLKEIRDALVKK